MVITLDSDLEAALQAQARVRGLPPDQFAVRVLRERLLIEDALQPRDEWERGLLQAAVNCRVSLPNAALGSEGIYE